MITQAELHQLFNYDPETGWFTNRTTRHYRALEGQRAGSPSGHGYRKVVIRSVGYYEHRLVWLYIHGSWPMEVDHIDRDRSNNSIANLRLCNRTQNNVNAERLSGQSGLRGAYLDKRTTRWYSHIQFGGTVEHLGMFDTAKEANEAYEAAALRLHGEFHLSHERAQ